MSFSILVSISFSIIGVVSLGFRAKKSRAGLGLGGVVDKAGLRTSSSVQVLGSLKSFVGNCGLVFLGLRLFRVQGKVSDHPGSSSYSR